MDIGQTILYKNRVLIHRYESARSRTRIAAQNRGPPRVRPAIPPEALIERQSSRQSRGPNYRESSHDCPPPNPATLTNLQTPTRVRTRGRQDEYKVHVPIRYRPVAGPGSDLITGDDLDSGRLD